MKFVIFDIDGTLTDTKEVDDKCFITAFLQTFNLDISNQKWEELRNVTDWGITEEIFERAFGRRPSAIDYSSMKSTFVSLLQKEKKRDVSQFKEVIGAKSFFIRLLNLEGVKVGIATGAWEESASLKLETIGIDFKNICFSNSSNFISRELITKDVIRQLEDKTDERADEIIYIGDGEWDYKTSQKLGLRFIGIDAQTNGKLKSFGVDKVYANYSNPNRILLDILKLN